MDKEKHQITLTPAQIGEYIDFKLKCGDSTPDECAAALQLKAKQEQGLVVELPCRVGDTVYCIIGGCVREGIAECWGIYEGGNIIGVQVDRLGRSCTWGKTVFLTRAEAEAAKEGLG